jgi:hypothetical protein
MLTIKMEETMETVEMMEKVETKETLETMDYWLPPLQVIPKEI